MKCASLSLRMRTTRHPRRCVAPRRRPRAVRCVADPVEALHGVKVTFTIPRHVEFGQSVCVLGSAEALGDWDVEKGACLTWGEGDVWSGVVELPRSLVEYKYFVKNPDGSAAEWQPCENLKADVEGEAMEVHDAWDGELQETTTEQDVTSEADLALPPEPEPLEETPEEVGTIVEAAIPESVQEMAEEVVADEAEAMQNSTTAESLSSA